MRYILSCLLLAFAGPLLAAEPITPPDAPIVVYKSNAGFDEVKENVAMAITGQGMLISGTLHISQMLDRTAKDTGFARLYEKAESLEFCSIKISHLMSAAHPANLTTCPLTIGIYVKVGEPDATYVAYQRPSLMGAADEATRALNDLMESLVQEALD